MLEERDTLSGLLPVLRRYAFALARHESDAEDLVQEALLRGHENRRSFREGGNLRAWLMAILHNAFMDRRRKAAASARRDAQLPLLQEEGIPGAQEAALRLTEVRRAFLALPQDQREAIHLVGVEGLTYAEAAEVAGVPMGTLISRVARGRAALRALEDETPPRLRVVGGEDA